MSDEKEVYFPCSNSPTGKKAVSRETALKILAKLKAGTPFIPLRPVMQITEKGFKKIAAKMAAEIAKRLKQKVVSVNKGKDRTRGIHLLGRIDDIASIFLDWNVQYVGQELIQRLPAINVVEEVRDERWPEGLVRVTDLDTGKTNCIKTNQFNYPGMVSVKGEMEVALAI